jgi:YD repeat-containing protein
VATSVRAHRELNATNALAAPATTGVWPWWTFKSRSIPGIGEGSVNVTNLNFLIAADDVEVPEGGVSLAFRRVYNSQSLHDSNNDDNSTPSVFGNKWTNNLDAHLGWSQIDQTNGTVSVYTGTGAREDFTCATNIEEACTSQTPGVHDILTSISITGGIACQYELSEKVGTTYVFTAPYSACGKLPGSYGRLITIWGRNNNYYLTLAYSWAPDASSPENISKIVVTHYPDQASLTLTFGQISGTSITELMSIQRPDKSSVNYRYNSTGGLTGVDKPVGNPVLGVPEVVPTAWPDGTAIPAGNLPQTYQLSGGGLLEACGPRAAIGSLPPNTGPQDGACVDFDYNSSTNQLTDWYTRGVLNPNPEDDVSYSAIQSGPSTGFVQWNDTTFFSNAEGSACNPYSEAGTSDADGHVTSWCYDSNGRVVEVAASVSGSSSLYGKQTWDSNNNRTSTTDARGNTTNIAYDNNGNIVEVSLPSQSVNPPGQNLRPTYLLDYDQYNNVTFYCDPANNPNNGWAPSQSDNLCQNSGSQYYTKFVYTYNDFVEPYGCLTTVTTPRGYHWNYTYAGTVGLCGIGMPTTVAGDQIQQYDQSNRTPTLDYSYDMNSGLLETFTPTGAQTNAWTINYTSNGMNLVRSVEDPDDVTSYACYNLDGSLFFTETAQQYKMDQSPACPSAQEIAGGANPPTYADAQRYDPDGNVAIGIFHNGCWGLNSQTAFSVCPATSPAPTNCNKLSVPESSTCYFYDGLGRIVEVKEPYDTSSDLYKTSWITRYLYDLSGGGTQEFYNQVFSAYGNLFEVEERLPQTPIVQVTATPLPGSIGNGVYQPIKAWASDALNRPVKVYAAMGSASPAPTPYTTETLTWDSTPINSDDVAGFLGEDCNSSSPQQCQEFDYTPDGQLKTFASSDSSAPQRSYQYDGDARPTQITSGAFSNPQEYSYDADGNVATSVDASNGAAAQNSATLTYHSYLDDTPKSLDVSSSALSQNGLFSYAYYPDVSLKAEAINDSSLQNAVAHPGTTTVSYTYTSAGRVSGRSESGADVDPNPQPTASVNYTSQGLVENMTYPQTTLYSFAFSVEDELVQLSDKNCAPWILYYYTVRGELAGGQNCSLGSPGGGYYANGLSPHTGGNGSWNSLMPAMLTASPRGAQSTWTYGNAGRMESQVAPYPTSSPAPTVTTTRTYDAENHLAVTTVESPSPSPSTWPYEQVTWGPDGHPTIIGTSQNGNAVKNERLHWNGDQLLFTTRDLNGNATVDDIKLDVQGDILPGDTYSGITFYDRGPGGMILGCHNYTGMSYAGFGGGTWSGFGVSPCNVNITPAGAKMPTSQVWAGSPYSGFTGEARIGAGGTLGTLRLDGFTDGFDTIQGVRAYDSTSGLWLTPDSYAGALADPRSQKSYTWNGNNPISNVDPSGYCTNSFVGGPGWGHSITCEDSDTWFPWGFPDLCNPAGDAVCGGGGPKGGLKTIAIVKARYTCNEESAPFSLPQGYTWGSEFNTAAANRLSVPNALGAYQAARRNLVGTGVFNYQARLGLKLRPSSNFGVGVWGAGAGIPEWGLDASIFWVGEIEDKPPLDPFEVLQDITWAHEGMQWAGSNCH